MAQHGFSFIEMLVCLSIISIMLLLSVPFQYDSINNQREEQFIEQLRHDVLFIQNQSSYFNQYKPFIHFYKDHYEMIIERDKVYATRNYPKNWSYASMNKIIEFAESGTMLYPRTIKMISPTEEINFVFQLGKGWFYVEAEKRLLHD